jgi:hypothetical protein
MLVTSAMKEQQIEGVLRQIEELRPAKGCATEERLRFLLKRRELRRGIDKGRIRGSVGELLEEVNNIYASDVDGDRIKESAKVIRLGLLWHAIERRRRGPLAG